MMTKVGYNYGRKEQCPVCVSGKPDQQQHLLTCDGILKEMTSVTFDGVQYVDIYSEDLKKMNGVGELLGKVIRKRKEIIDNRGSK